MVDDKTLKALVKRDWGKRSLNLVRMKPHCKERQQQPDAVAEAGSTWLTV